MAEAAQTVIPNRQFFKAAEVCELVKVQPYVLRSWENEFPELGAQKTAGGPRLYRRADVEQLLRIKHLLLVEGLTLAGARRRLDEAAAQPQAAAPVAAAGPASAPVAPAAMAAAPPFASVPAAPQPSAATHPRRADDAHERLTEVKRGLRSILDLLSDAPDDGFALDGAASKPASRPTAAARPSSRSEERRTPTTSRTGARKRSA